MFGLVCFPELAILIDFYFSFFQFNGTWVSDHEFLFADYRTGLNLVDLKDQSKSRQVLSRAHLTHYNPYR